VRLRAILSVRTRRLRGHNRRAEEYHQHQQACPGQFNLPPFLRHPPAHPHGSPSSHAVFRLPPENAFHWTYWSHRRSYIVGIPTIQQARERLYDGARCRHRPNGAHCRSGFLASPRLHQEIEDFALAVHGASQPPVVAAIEMTISSRCHRPPGPRALARRFQANSTRASDSVILDEAPLPIRRLRCAA
jgi:hypothetical protein